MNLNPLATRDRVNADHFISEAQGIPGPRSGRWHSDARCRRLGHVEFLLRFKSNR